MARGGRRKPDEVPEEVRECQVHGRSPFRRYTHPNTGTMTWVCVICNREKSKRYYEAVKTGAHTIIPVDFSNDAEPDSCKHRWQRDTDQDQDWCHGWRCVPCGTSTITAPGESP